MIGMNGRILSESTSMMRRACMADLNSSSIGKSRDGMYGFLTKGDNSPFDDTMLYPLQQRYLSRSDIVGSVRGHIPYVGQLTLLLGDVPCLKQALLVVSTVLFMNQLR